MDTTVGPLRGESAKLFEEGVEIVLSKWTALCLAVENQWGGNSSKEKAEQMWEDVLYWFDVTKSPIPQTLEDQLETALLEDFNVLIEDGSTAEISKTLVHLFEELCNGSLTLIQSLRSSGQSGAEQSQKAGKVESSSSSEESGSEMDEDEVDTSDMNRQNVPGPSVPPVVDDDGFILVQGRKRPN